MVQILFSAYILSKEAKLLHKQSKTKVPKWTAFDNKVINRWRKEGAAVSRMGGHKPAKQLKWY